MRNKIIKNSLNTIYLVLILVVINIAIQTSLQKTNIKKKNNSLKAKSSQILYGVTGYKSKNWKNGEVCDNNVDCESRFCGYTGDAYLNKEPEVFNCMVKNSKPEGAPCWNHNECRLRTIPFGPFPGDTINEGNCKRGTNGWRCS
jgi:hypothetical protein